MEANMPVIYIILYIIILIDLYNGYSIKKEIDSARQFLKNHGIPDLNFCKAEHRHVLCKELNDTIGKVCSARIVRKRFEFKEFDSQCHLDLYNFCDSHDNIWAIKNAGNCEMNYLRRYGNEKIADNGTNSVESAKEWHENEKKENDDVTSQDTNAETQIKITPVDVIKNADKTEADVDATKPDDTELNESEVTLVDAAVEEVTGGEKDKNTDEVSPKETTVEEIPAADTEEIEDTTIGDETTVAENDNPSGYTYVDEDSEKLVLRNDPREERFQDFCARMNHSFCPAMYNPVCLYFGKEDPENVTYYLFTNKCEAIQFQCFHPEETISNKYSPTILRSTYCAHIKYINYARFIHTISAWGHYGWLYGPGRFDHILKPNERVQ